MKITYVFRVTRVVTPTFVHTTFVKVTFSFDEFVSPCKQSVYFTDSFLRYCQIQSRITRVAKPIFDHTQLNVFHHLLPRMNSYQHSKIRLFYHFVLREIFDLKILQSDWPSAFWIISQEPDLCRYIVNNINFHYRPNSTKINDQFFQKSSSVRENCIWVSNTTSKFLKS